MIPACQVPIFNGNTRRSYFKIIPIYHYPHLAGKEMNLAEYTCPRQPLAPSEYPCLTPTLSVFFLTLPHMKNR